MTEANRIKKIRLAHKQTAAQLGSAIGKSQSTIAKWEAGDGLTHEGAMLVADYYKMSVDYVLGKIDMPNPDQDLVAIDIYDAVASCGSGTENINPQIIGKQFYTLEAFKRITCASCDKVKIIRARGDSMQPTINDGDYAMVDMSQESPTGDGLYLICIKSDLFIKRIRFDFLNKTALVLSDNEKYPPIHTDDPDGIHVLGKVISITKMLA